MIFTSKDVFSRRYDNSSKRTNLDELLEKAGVNGKTIANSIIEKVGVLVGFDELKIVDNLDVFTLDSEIETETSLETRYPYAFQLGDDFVMRLSAVAAAKKDSLPSDTDLEIFRASPLNENARNITFIGFALEQGGITIFDKGRFNLGKLVALSKGETTVEKFLESCGFNDEVYDREYIEIQFFK